MKEELPFRDRVAIAMNEAGCRVTRQSWVRINVSIDGDIVVNHGSVHHGVDECSIQTIKVRPNGHVAYLTHP
jgi:hypothetical protein